MTKETLSSIKIGGERYYQADFTLEEQPPSLEEFIKELCAITVNDQKQSEIDLVPVGFYSVKSEPVGCSLLLDGYEEYTDLIRRIIESRCADDEYHIAEDLGLSGALNWLDDIPSKSKCNIFEILDVSETLLEEGFEASEGVVEDTEEHTVLSAFKEDARWNIIFFQIKEEYINSLTCLLMNLSDYQTWRTS